MIRFFKNYEVTFLFKATYNGFNSKKSDMAVVFVEARVEEVLKIRRPGVREICGANISPSMITFFAITVGTTNTEIPIVK